MLSLDSRKLLDAALEACGGNQSALARELSKELNREISRVMVNGMVRDRRDMSADERRALEAIVAKSDESQAKHGSKARLKPDIEPGQPAEGSREPPFLGLIPGVEKMSILAGKSLEWSEMVVELAPVERVARPWFLGEVKEAFGLIVSTENMLPVTEAGDTVIVNEKLPLRRTREALFCSAKENNVFRAILARFIGQTQSHWTIEEDSPGTGEDGKRILPKADWPDAFPVVAKIIGR